MNIKPIQDTGSILSTLTGNPNVQPIEPKGGADSGDSKSFQAVWNTQTTNANGGTDSLVKGADPAAKTAPERKDPKPSQEKAQAAEAPRENRAVQNAGRADGNAAENAAEDAPVREAAPEKPADEPMTDEEVAAAAEALAPFAAQILTRIEDVLGISAEDAENLLADLDLDAADLLDPQNLSAFLFEAMGVESQVELLTDETAFASFKELTGELKNVLAQESGVQDQTVGQLAQALEKTAAEDVQLPVQPEENAEAVPVQVQETAQDVQFPAQPQAEAVPVQAQGAAQDVSLQAQPEAVPVQTQGAAEDAQLREQPEARAEAVPVQAQEAAAGQNRRADERGALSEEDERSAVPVHAEGEVSESELRGVTTSDGQSLGMEQMLRSGRRNAQERGEGHGTESQQAAASFQSFEPEIAPEAAVETLQGARGEQAQEIADQILDYMRAQVRPDLSSVEMQLHPATLGTLRIQITNTAGSVTANFITQNEQVRAAIEGQMVQLREQFEEQGIKVQAVEVTVESHAFEQNLEQNAQSGQNAETQERQTRRTRRINLSELGEEGLEGIEGAGELSEADRIAAEMMQANGNTVDYTA